MERSCWGSAPQPQSVVSTTCSLADAFWSITLASAARRRALRCRRRRSSRIRRQSGPRVRQKTTAAYPSLPQRAARKPPRYSPTEATAGEHLSSSARLRSLRSQPHACLRRVVGTCPCPDEQDRFVRLNGLRDRGHFMSDRYMHRLVIAARPPLSRTFGAYSLWSIGTRFPLHRQQRSHARIELLLVRQTSKEDARTMRAWQ